MRAAVAYEGATEFRAEDLAIPELYDGEVLMRVKAAGLNEGQTKNWRFGTHVSDLPRPIGMHMSGEVVEVGRGVTKVKPGMRIKPDPVLSCGRCWACVNDDRARCKDVVLIGWNYRGNNRELFERFKSGMTAEYMRLPESACVPIPDNISYDTAAHIGTLGVSLNGLRKTGVGYGQTLLVNGASGGNGSAVLKMAPLLGISRVIAVARHREALEAAAKASPGPVDIIVLNDMPENWRETGGLTKKIRDMTDGQGVDGMVDFLPAGVDVTKQGLFAMKRGGKAVLFGGMREELSLRYIDAFPLANIQLEGVNGHGVGDVLMVNKWLEEGKLCVDDFVTHRFPLEEINQGLALIDSGKPFTWMVINP